MIEVYKLLTGRYSTIERLLKLTETVRSRRGHHLKLEKRFRLQIRKHSFPIRVVNPWNLLPKHVVLAPTLNTFKNRLNRYWGHFQYNVEKPPYMHRVKIDPVRSSRDVQQSGSSVSMSLPYWMSAPAWQLLVRTSDIFRKDWSIF